METKIATHTPGPWILETVRTSVGVCHKIGKLGESTKLNHACLYDDCYSAQPRDLQLLADARLIAAAPELLEACKALVALCDRTGYHPTEECKLAQSAIDKAEAQP